ncbi:uncharacterized protein G2W53_003787 [Senna tora]|uniref:Uncharacterized protein n=1 Tax=Senna tora TaxID=362788 RepID=A0A834XC38_9FABA|nr:uncharacterized protein G2W53_003787 [Senna tora]
MDQHASNFRNAEARAKTGEFDATFRPNSTQQPIRGVMNVSPEALTPNNIAVSFDENVTQTSKTPQSIAKDLSIQPDKFQNKRPKKQNIRIMPNEALARTQDVVGRIYNMSQVHQSSPK